MGREAVAGALMCEIFLKKEEYHVGQRDIYVCIQESLCSSFRSSEKSFFVVIVYLYIYVYQLRMNYMQNHSLW